MNMLKLKHHAAIFVAALVLGFLLVALLPATEEDPTPLFTMGEDHKALSVKIQELEFERCTLERRLAYEKIVALADKIPKEEAYRLVGVMYTECVQEEIESFQDLQDFEEIPVSEPLTEEVVQEPQEDSPVSAAVLLDPVAQEPTYDLDCLADAVAVAETSYCQAGAGLTNNNCFGLMAWNSEGKRYLQSFSRNEESFDAFKLLWSTKYGVYPNLSVANTYTGSDNAVTWLANVNTAYNRCNDRKLGINQ